MLYSIGGSICVTGGLLSWAVIAGSREAVSVVRTALGGISEWFDEYIATEEV